MLARGDRACLARMHAHSSLSLKASLLPPEADNLIGFMPYRERENNKRDEIPTKSDPALSQSSPWMIPVEILGTFSLRVDYHPFDFPPHPFLFRDYQNLRII